ncbi:MAG: trimethylamine methyltransferase family protein [bacterium]|nr:trimethylamine methyltransferase family protein [bacterium]
MKNRVNYQAYNTPMMKVMSDSQCAEIVAAAKEMMFRTGIEFHDEQAREIMKKHGCFVEGIRVRIPPYITERALLSSQKHITLCNNRTGNPEIFLDTNHTYFGPGPGNPFWRHPYTGERIRTSYESVCWASKLLDALPNIDYAQSLGIVQDRPKLIADRYELEAQFLNTSKPIVNVCCDQWGQEDCIKMAQIMAGGADELRKHPIMTVYIEPISPGIIAEESCVKIIQGAEQGLPIIFTPCIMAGGTAPATLAGVMAQGIAESLAGLVLSQCAGEGSGFIIGGVYTVLDMGSTIFSYGAPELDLMLAALTDVGHYMKLPVFGTGGCTDSSIIDEQAGIEAALSLAMTSFSGPNLHHDIGYSEYGTTSNFDLVVIDNDIVGMARRITAGIPVTEKSLSLGELESTKPGGRFENDWSSGWDSDEDYEPKNPHENFDSKLISRAAYDLWKGDGRKSYTERANELVRDIIENYEPAPLANDIKAKLKNVVENAVGRIPGVSK